MKIFKRILFGLVVLVLVAAAAAFFYGRHLARRRCRIIPRTFAWPE